MGFFSSNKDKNDASVNNKVAPNTAVKKDEIIQNQNEKPEIKIPIQETKQNNITLNTPITNITNTTNITNNNNINNKNMTIITAGTILEGQMKVDTDIQIDGIIKGTVTCKNKVILGANGKVDGDIICQEAEVNGKVTGKITVKDILFLKGNANIDGDIVTGKLVMESGVKFNGKCNMTGIAPAATNNTPSANGIATPAETAKANA